MILKDMPKERLELSIPYENCDLNAARMPIPPLRLYFAQMFSRLSFVELSLYDFSNICKFLRSQRRKFFGEEEHFGKLFINNIYIVPYGQRIP